MKKIAAILIIFFFASAISNRGYAESQRLQESFEAFDRLPVAALIPLLQMKEVMDPLQTLRGSSPLSQFATSGPGSESITFPIPNEIAALLKLVNLSLQLYKQFEGLKDYWQKLYGAVEYIKTRQFWLAQILDPLSACLPNGALYVEGALGEKVAVIKEFLQYMAGNRDYWVCSTEVKEAINNLIGGIPYIYDENGSVIPSPNSTRRSWAVYAVNDAIRKRSAASKAVQQMVNEADRLSEAIGSQNIPKNTAITAGHVLRAEASEAQISASIAELETLEKGDELASAKALEEVTSASYEAFRLLPTVLTTEDQQ